MERKNSMSMDSSQVEHSPFTHILKKAVFSDWSIQPVGSMYVQKTIQMMMESLTTQKRVLEWIQIQTTPMGTAWEISTKSTLITPMVPTQTQMVMDSTMVTKSTWESIQTIQTPTVME